MNQSTAEVVREYGPFPGAGSVAGVTFDGQQVWFASGEKLNAFDPANGKTVRSIESDGGDQFFCGGGNSGKVRVVRRPKGKNKDTARGRTVRR